MKIGLSDKIKLDRRSATPLARQIQEQIEAMIRSREIDNDYKIPSTRVLSKNLGVNRATVATAYRRLEEKGLARSGVGSGTYAIQPSQDQTEKLDQSNYRIGFSSGAENLLRFQAELPDFGSFKAETCNFAALVPDENLFPVERFRECINHTLDNEKGRALQYSGTLGYQPLRKMIAQVMARQGSDVAPDRILIVSGAQQGCDLIFRSFLSPGDRAVVGSPTYHNIYPLLKQMDVGIAPVPVSSDGMDTAALERAVRDPGVRLIYTMPNFQNPTGVTATHDNRSRVLEITASANLPVLEDDYEGDLGTSGDVMPSIHSLDRDGRVIYLGTFSKSLFPGLRVGWLAASRDVIDVVSALKKASDLENSALLQGALFEFCKRGYYEEHLQTVRAAIRERTESAVRALARHMPEGTGWSEPKGGYGLWVTLPQGVRSDRVYLRAGKRGVLVSPGTLFTGGEDPGAIRLSISRTPPDVIDKGIRILAEIVSAEVEGAGTAAGSAISETPQHL
jgi:GntR family transcriptional regulator/MocR family aminotransferase